MTERPLNILLVDGDEVFLRVLKGILLSAGQFRIDTAPRVAEALEKLRSNHFDVCFLEYGFVDGTGVDILRAVEKRDLRTAFIFLTEAADKNTAFAALRHGAMDYLVKSRLEPFDLVKSLAFSLFRKGKEMVLSATALRDSLTGLGNRVLFREQTSKLILQAKRAHHQVGVVFMDIDGLKPVNDTHGHPVGDQLLRQIANRILQQTRESDIVARMGGDEFVAVLPSIEGPKVVSHVAGALTQAISQTPFRVGAHDIHVGMSCGTALYPTDSDNVDDLVRLADLRMYENKARRKAKAGYAGRAMAWMPSARHA